MRRFWRKNEEGMAALEFALLGPIFFAFIMVIIDIALYIGTRTIVEDAVETGSRAVRLGILQQADGEEAFRDVLCSRIMYLKCELFQFSVEAPAGGLDTDEFDPLLTKEGNFAARQYDPGGSEDIVVVTVLYTHNFIFPYIGEFFGDDGLLNNKSRVIASYLVFRNEPYPEDIEYE